MNTIYHKITGFAAALLLSATVTSCMTETSETAASQSEKGTFTLNITSTPVGTTRAATNIGGTSAEQAASKSAGEKSINRFVMAVFDNDASFANLMGKAVASASGTIFEESKSFDTGGMADGDSIYVAANIPSAKLNTYKDYDKSTFATTPLTIDEALTPVTSGTLSDSDLPMFGKGAVSDEGEGSYSATVSLKHLVAKVSLNSLSCDFTSTAHTSASFRPTQLFLINVPQKIDMQVTAGGGSCYGVTNTEFYQGEANSWSTDAAADQRQYAEYLGTSVMASETKITNGNSWGKVYSLFALPNNDASNQTKLVIKGRYSDDGTDANEHDAYYAVPLGKASNDLRVQMNTIYKLSVVIKGDGAPDAYSAIPSYQNLTSTITYEDWTEHSTTVIAGNGGLDYSTLQAPKVGDLYFSDGTWGSYADYPDKTPIGIVFSTVTSSADQALGYKKGYVMALKRANSGNNVANWCANVSSLQSTLITRTTPAEFFSPVTALMADMEGLTYCNTAIQYCTSNSIDPTNLTAIQAAKGYTPAPPASTTALPNSGWYLPSIGQQYLWLKNLANAGSDPEGSTVYTGAETVWTDNSTYWTHSGAAPAAVTAINDYCKAKLSSTTNQALWEDFAQGHYLWSSTERISSHPFHLSFGTDSNLYLHGGDDKSATVRQVRAVLAF